MKSIFNFKFIQYLLPLADLWTRIFSPPLPYPNSHPLLTLLLFSFTIPSSTFFFTFDLYNSQFIGLFFGLATMRVYAPSKTWCVFNNQLIYCLSLYHSRRYSQFGKVPLVFYKNWIFLIFFKFFKKISQHFQCLQI